MEVTLKAYAKINLALDVLYKRADGYHELSTVMQAIDVFDTVSLSPAEKGTITVDCDEWLPKENTAYRAAKRFMELTNCGGVHITLTKGIPTRAGLGGASADAAAVIEGMRRLYAPISLTQAFAIAKDIGADVPFCLHSGCALCEGVGERLTKLKGIPLNLVVIKGVRGVSTAALFKNFLIPGDARHTAQAAASAIEKGDKDALIKSIGNALTPAASLICPEINSNIKLLLSLGASCACMTGSGSAVFGVFRSSETAYQIAEKIKSSHSSISFAVATKTLV